MADVHTITNSEISAMDHCMKKWYFGYDQQLMSKAPSAPLDIGSATHEGIELYYTNPDLTADEIISQTISKYEESQLEFERKGGWPKDPSEQEEEKTLISSMLREYIRETAALDNFKIVSLEEEFNLPLINPYTKQEEPNLRLLGKIDGWCSINSYNFLLEHKTAASMQGDWWWKYLNQVYLYIYAMQRKHDISFTGAYINLLIKKVPSKPKFTKKGELSKAACNATVESFTRGLIENGKDPKDFQEELSKLAERGNAFIFRKAIYLNQDELKEAELRVWHAMQRKLTDTYYARHRSDLCNRMCSFKSLCTHDIPEIREELYIKREKRHAELGD